MAAHVGDLPGPATTGAQSGPTAGHNVVAHSQIFGGNVTYNFQTEGTPVAPTNLPRMIPFPRNETIVDRHDLFAALDRLLPPTATSQSAALWGLGGSGKTQIALEYAYRRAGCAVFWVHADDETTFTQDYKHIARRLGGLESLDGDDLLTAVRDRIESLESYLLVLDNADDLRLFGVGQSRSSTEKAATEVARNLATFIPRGTGTVLWTSRDGRIIGPIVGPGRAINVQHMAAEEAMRLFETAQDRTVEDSETKDVEKLLAELEWLPLAVVQAATYIRRTSTTAAAYLERLSKGTRRWRLLEKNEGDRHRRPEVSNSILETWNISVEHIRAQSSLLYGVLLVLVFVDYRAIPEEMMQKTVHHVRSGREQIHLQNKRNEGGEDDSDRADQDTNGNDDDEEEVIEVCARLRELSFLSQIISSDGSTAYEIHKLVQEALRYRLSHERWREEQRCFASIAFDVTNSLFPLQRHQLMDQCETYLVHAQEVSKWAEKWAGEIQTSALLRRVSKYLDDLARWREKEYVDLSVYKLRKKVLGDRHQDTIRSMADLAATYYQLGRYSDAEKIEVEVVNLRRQALGGQHPDTIRGIAELALTLNKLGRYREAEEMGLEVLNVRRQVLGDQHPDTIRTIGDLAVTYHRQGRYDEAERMEIEVLDFQRRILGDRDLDTISSMSCLGSTYSWQGQYDKAKGMFAEALGLRRQVLGEQHPDTIRSMTYLASTYSYEGQYDKAKGMFVEALELQRQVLGEQHPNTISTMAFLGTVCYRLRQYDEAEKLEMEVVHLRRQLLGDQHPDTIESLASLAITYYELRRYSEAERLYIEVVGLQRQLLGDQHPDTIKSIADLEMTQKALELGKRD